MTKQQRLFVQTCRALWGPTYQSAALQDLGLSRSSLVRYANGTRPIPQGVFELLEQRLAVRAQAIGDLRLKVADARGA